MRAGTGRGDSRHGELLYGLIGLIGGTLLAGCVTVPAGPTVSVLPGSSVPFAVFQADDAACRNFALAAVDPNAPAVAGTESAVGGALLGAAIGALIGSATGDAGAGAAIGGGTGLWFGSAVGADRANATAYYGQQRYNHAYVQCMYAQGHRVPMHLAPVAAPAVRPPPASTVQPRGYPPWPYPR